VTAPLLCECSTFAVGLCGSCQRPVCADHSGLVGGRRLCVACGEAAKRADTATAEQVRRSQLEQLAAIKDPVTRLVSSVRYFAGDRSHRIHRHMSFEDLDLVVELCPEAVIPREGLGYKDADMIRYQNPWDPQVVARWFVGQAKKAGLRPDSTWAPVTEKRNLLGTYRRVVGDEVAAWNFLKGSTIVKTEMSSGVMGRFEDLAIGGSRQNGFVTVNGYAPWGLGQSALADMADLLRIPSWLAR
jgi:hypothetical protein